MSEIKEKNEPLNKNNKVPKLRFNEFENFEWKECRLSDISCRLTNKNKDNKPLIPLTISAQDGLINQYDYFDKQIASINLSTYYILKKGQFAYNKSYSNGYPYGTIKRLENYDEGALSSLYICFEIKNIDSDFICKYFDSNKWNYEVKLISGEGARNHGLLNLSPSDFFNIKIYVPINKNEQIKIAKFIELIQKKINVSKEKIEFLKKYKKGLIESSFSVGRLDMLSNYIKMVDVRNKKNDDIPVLSVSNKRGFISQEEQFDGNEVASKNKKNYKLVKQNQFAYNPARINVGSIAYLQSLDLGQVSPMYVTFKTMNVSNTILNEYFHSSLFKKEMRIHLEGSVRQVLSFENLCKFKISIPNNSEDFERAIKCINEKINFNELSLNHLLNVKKELLNSMFI